MANILIVEDEKNMQDIIVEYIKKGGHTCFTADDGIDALMILKNNPMDLMILDIMMPGYDGIQVLQKLRRKKITTPVLFLTARTEVEQRVEGLDAGADDYLPKPFAASELLARTRAMLRRKDNYCPDLLALGDVFLNRSTYGLSYKEGIESLSGKEFQIMEIYPDTKMKLSRYLKKKK